MVSLVGSPPATSLSYNLTTPPSKFCLNPCKQRKCSSGKCRKMSPASPSTVWSLPREETKETQQQQEDDVDMDAIWEEAMMCKDAFMQTSEDDSSDDEWDIGPVRRKVKPIMVTLPCGDIHLCGGGYECPYQVPNEDRIMVCMYTGVEFGPEHTDEYFDLNGGSGKKSGDPDQSCGEPVHGGKWGKRADPFAASRAAYQAASSFDEDDSNYLRDMASKSEPARKPSKRGALCVGESAPPQCGKRGRASKRNTTDRGTMVSLLSEAESVITKLVNYDKASSFKQKAQGDKVERKRPPPDPRMCDEKFVFNTSVKKYVRGCLSNGTAPSMDAIHNISLLAQTISAKAREEAAQSDSDAVRTVKFRTACANLIVTLWSAVCSSPYMESSKKGGDAYRPFICGCLYAAKRGVTLKDGTVLIPTCPQLAAALPVLRGTGGNAMAKTLHSSSHRGLCTLSRCIASVPQKDQKKVFETVIRCAERFSSQTFSKFDI